MSSYRARRRSRSPRRRERDRGTRYRTREKSPWRERRSDYEAERGLQLQIEKKESEAKKLQETIDSYKKALKDSNTQMQSAQDEIERLKMELNSKGIPAEVQLQLENLQKEKNELSMLHQVLTRTNVTLQLDTNTLQEIVKMLQTLPQFQNASAPEAVKTLIKNYKDLLEEKALLETKTTQEIITLRQQLQNMQKIHKVNEGNAESLLSNVIKVSSNSKKEDFVGQNGEWNFEKMCKLLIDDAVKKKMKAKPPPRPPNVVQPPYQQIPNKTQNYFQYPNSANIAKVLEDRFSRQSNTIKNNPPHVPANIPNRRPPVKIGGHARQNGTNKINILKIKRKKAINRSRFG